MRQIGVEVFQGVFRADGRDGDLHLDDFIFLGVVFGQESQIRARRLRAALEADGAPFDLRAAAEAVAAVDHRLAVADDLVMIERPGVTRGEIQMPLLRPAVFQMIAGHRRVVLDADVRPDDVPVQNVFQIGENPRLLALGKGDAEHRGAVGGRQFDPGVVISQLDLVVARRGGFLVVRNGRLVAGSRLIGRAGLEFRLARARHEQEIAQVPPAGSAEVRHAEAVDHRIGMIVAAELFARWYRAPAGPCRTAPSAPDRCSPRLAFRPTAGCNPRAAAADSLLPQHSPPNRTSTASRS